MESIETINNEVEEKRPQNNFQDDFEWKSGSFTKSLAFSIALGKTRAGYAGVVFNEIQNFMVNLFKWNEEESNFYKGFITSIFSLGSIFGMAFGLSLLQRYGRKASSLIIDLVALIGVIVTLVASPSAFIFGRFVIGLAAGGDAVLVPIYLKEISSLDRRGLILGISSFLWAFGVLLSYTMDTGLPEPDSNGSYASVVDNQWWRIQFGLPIIFSVIRIIFVNLIYDFETPMFVFQSASLNKEYKAKEALERIIRSDVIPKYMEEVVCLTQECKNRRFVTIKELFGFAYRRATFLLSIMGALIIFSGGDLSLAYLTSFLTSSSLNVLLMRIIKVLIGLTLISAFAINMLTADQIGRRNYMILGGAVVTVILIIMTVVNLSLNDFFIGNVVLMFLYCFSFYSTNNPAYFTYFAEILPDIGVTFIYLFLAMIFFILQFLFPALLSGFGKGGVQLIFTISSAFSFFFSLMFLPSTKNKTFSQIFSAFHGNYFQRRLIIK